MKKSITLLVAIFLIGCGCSRVNQLRAIDPSLWQKVTAKRWQLEPFQVVVLRGSGQFELITGATYGIEIIGDELNEYSYYSDSEAKTVYLNGEVDIAAAGKAPTILRLSAPTFNQLFAADEVVLNAREFRANKLSIVAAGRSIIKIRGEMKLTEVSQLDQSNIDLSWVNSEKLLVDGRGTGVIYLAGVADKLMVKLREKSRLNANYLRAKEAEILTADRAKAAVLVVANLDAFAIDHSNIYYYKRPEKLTVITKNSGNVLQLGWWR